MARSTRRRLVSLIAATTAIFSVQIAGVFADSKTDNCFGDGDEFSATTYYHETTTGTGWRVVRQQFTIDGNTDPHNNVYLRLRGNGGEPTYWGWTSGDGINGGVTYEVDVATTAPKSQFPYMKGHAIFDQFGPDPNCDTYVFLT